VATSQNWKNKTIGIVDLYDMGTYKECMASKANVIESQLSYQGN